MGVRRVKQPNNEPPKINPLVSIPNPCLSSFWRSWCARERLGGDLEGNEKTWSMIYPKEHIEVLRKRLKRFRYGIKPKSEARRFKRLSRQMQMCLTVAVLKQIHRPPLRFEAGGVHSSNERGEPVLRNTDRAMANKSPFDIVSLCRYNPNASINFETMKFVVQWES